MLAQQTKSLYMLNQFYVDRVRGRNAAIYATLSEMVRIVQDLLKEVELLEPRFISTLIDCNGRFEGVEVISANEFEVVLYLNQMGVFNFVDDGSWPGCAVLKLSDGRKRSMSLWVEFITASGYLSSRKIRSRFQTLVAQAIEKCPYRELIKMVPDSSEVRLRIRDAYNVQITPAFKCHGIWPRSACHWPVPQLMWPNPALVVEVKQEGFSLLSKDCPQTVTAKQQQQQQQQQQSAAAAGSLTGTNAAAVSASNNNATSSSASLSSQSSSTIEGDAWVMSFTESEFFLLHGGCRRRALSILKTLRDRHLSNLPGDPITNYVMKTLLLYECEKHSHEIEWTDLCLFDRLNGILLQLISCLQCRKCPHYFLPNLDLLRGKAHEHLDLAAKQVWRLTRDLIINLPELLTS